MEIDFLRHYGFPSSLLKTLQNAFGPNLLPLQEKVIREGGLFENKSLMVSAPTSSGKTFLAEALFLHHALQGKNALLLVPTKALANQRYHQWRQRYAPLGYDILLSTRDHPYDDQRLLEGRFHLAIVIYEKMRALLARNDSLLSSLGACVVDELHYLYHPQRGPDLELLLTHLRQVESLQMLGLSALLADEVLAEWLKAKWIRETHRPVELRQGVLCNGHFTYQEFNSQKEGKESFPLEEDHDEGMAMIEAAKYFAARGETTLIFWASRDLCNTAARKLANEMEACFTLDERIEQMENTHMRRFLQMLLPRGIAVHTSDLTREERWLVEERGQSGELKIICATTTLAEGINFPVTNVLTMKKTYGPSISPGKPSSAVPLSREQMFNMIGRAGRLGLSEFGRGMVVTCSPGDVEGLMNMYPRGESKALSPTLHRLNWREMVLKTLPAEGYVTRERIIEFLANTLSGLHDCFDSLETHVEQTLEQLRREEFITNEQGRFYATPIGLLVICHGLSQRSAQRFENYLREFEGESPHELEILAMVNLVDELIDTYCPVSRSAFTNHHWTRLISEHITEAGLRRDSFLMEFINSPHKIRREHHSAFKKILLLREWSTGKEIPLLEEKFGQLSGAILRLAEEASWLIGCLHDLASAYASPAEMLQELQSMIERVKYGLPREALDWSQFIRREILHRSDVLQLLEAGYASPRNITNDDRKILCQWLSDETLDHLIKEEMGSESQTDTASLTVEWYEGKPNYIYLNEHQIKLSRLQTELMRRLMAKPKQCVEYDYLINELWPNDTGSRDKLYRRRDEINKKASNALGDENRILIHVAEGIGMVLDAEVKRHKGLRE